MLGQPAIDVEADIAGGVDFQRNLALPQPEEQRRIFNGAHPMTDTVSRERAHSIRHAGGAHGLPGMGH